MLETMKNTAAYSAILISAIVAFFLVAAMVTVGWTLRIAGTPLIAVYGLIGPALLTSPALHHAMKKPRG